MRSRVAVRMASLGTGSRVLVAPRTVPTPTPRMGAPRRPSVMRKRPDRWPRSQLETEPRASNSPSSGLGRSMARRSASNGATSSAGGLGERAPKARPGSVRSACVKTRLPPPGSPRDKLEPCRRSDDEAGRSQDRPSAAPSTRASPPTPVSSRTSTRSTTSAKRPQPTSKARPMRDGSSRGSYVHLVKS